MEYFCGTMQVELEEFEAMLKARKKSLKIIEQFKDVIKGKDTWDNLIKQNTDDLLGLMHFNIQVFRIDVRDNRGFVISYMNHLINEYKNHDYKFQYIKFGDKYIEQNIRYKRRFMDVIHEYGLLVYYIEENKLHRFIFHPFINRYFDINLYEVSILTDLDLIDYVKIDKPNLKLKGEK